MRTIGFRLTNISTGTLFLSDIPDARVLTAWRKPGPLYIGPGATVELLYTGSTALSFELGSIRGFVDQGLLTAEFIEGEGVPGGTQLVYAPMAATGEANYVFKDFSELYAKFQATPGLIEIFFDFPNGLPPVAGLPPEFRSFPIPAGAYDFEQRAFWTAKSGDALAVAIPQPGVEIRRLNGIEGSVGVFNTTAAPIIYVSNESAAYPEVFFLRNGAAIAIGPGGAPVMQLAEPGSGLTESILVMDNGDVIDPLGVGTGVVEVAPNGVGLVAVIGPLGDLETDTFVGDATASLIAVIGTPSASMDFMTQTGFLGFIGEFLVTDSSQSLYTPAVLADWSGIDPGNVAQALDRIAAAIGPIA